MLVQNPTDFIYGDLHTYQAAGKSEVMSLPKLFSSWSICVQYIIPVQQQQLKLPIHFVEKVVFFSGLLFSPHTISKKHYMLI